MHGEIVYAKDVNKEKLEKFFAVENNIEYLENKYEKTKKEIDEEKAFNSEVRKIVKLFKWSTIIASPIMSLLSFGTCDAAMTVTAKTIVSLLFGITVFGIGAFITYAFNTRLSSSEKSLIRRMKAKKILEQDIEKEKEKQKLLQPSKEEDYEIVKVRNNDIEDYEIKYNHLINHGLPTKLMEETTIDEEVEEKGKVKTLNRK